MSEVDDRESGPGTGADLSVPVDDSQDLERARALSKYEDVVARDDYEPNLIEAAEDYLDEASFKAGDLVQWKPRMRNAFLPEYGRPMVVIDEVSAEARAGMSFLPGQPDEFLATMLTGFLDGDNDFVMIRVDPRRVRVWQAPGGGDPSGRPSNKDP